MTEDSSLTDFLEDRDGSDGDGALESEAGTDAPDESERGIDAPARDETDAPAEETPAGDAGRDSGRSTYAWGTYACARCAERTERVWRDGDGDALVCLSCKSW